MTSLTRNERVFFSGLESQLKPIVMLSTSASTKARAEELPETRAAAGTRESPRSPQPHESVLLFPGFTFQPRSAPRQNPNQSITLRSTVRKIKVHIHAALHTGNLLPSYLGSLVLTRISRRSTLMKAQPKLTAGHTDSPSRSDSSLE